MKHFDSFAPSDANPVHPNSGKPLAPRITEILATLFAFFGPRIDITLAPVGMRQAQAIDQIFSGFQSNQ
jgi:hypothetical protein